MPAARRFAYLVDVGSSGTVSLFTTGTAGDAAYESQAGLVTLMAGASTFVSGRAGRSGAQARHLAIEQRLRGHHGPEPLAEVLDLDGRAGFAASAGSQAYAIEQPVE